MAVEATFGETYQNVAGFLVQAGLTPANGFLLGGDVYLRTLVFLHQDSKKSMPSSPALGTSNTLVISGEGATITLPEIQYRGEIVSFHNQRAVKCLEFRYNNIKSVEKATATVKMDPVNVKTGQGRPNGSVQISGGTECNVVGQQHRKFDNGATVVRILSESQSGDEGWLAEMLKQNMQIQAKKPFDLAFNLHGKAITHGAVSFQFVEYEERFGIANYCDLAPLHLVEEKTQPLFQFPEINERFAATSADFVRWLSGGEKTKLEGGMPFIEVITFKSNNDAARALDLQPSAWA